MAKSEGGKWKSALEDADWMSRIIAISGHLVDVTPDDWDRMACELVDVYGDILTVQAARKSATAFAAAFRKWTESPDVASIDEDLCNAFDKAVAEGLFPEEVKT